MDVHTKWIKKYDGTVVTPIDSTTEKSRNFAICVTLPNLDLPRIAVPLAQLFEFRDPFGVIFNENVTVKGVRNV